MMSKRLLSQIADQRSVWDTWRTCWWAGWDARARQASKERAGGGVEERYTCSNVLIRGIKDGSVSASSKSA